MGAESVSDIVMKYWHHRVSIDDSFLRLRMDEESCVTDFYSIHPKVGVKICGFYAKYNEGLVFLFRNQEKVYVSVNSKIFGVDGISRISWGSTICGRFCKIQFLDKRNPEIFRYKTLWRDAINVFGLFRSLGDEDWGLVADMPSFIHSFFNDGTLVDKLDMLIERE